MKILLILTDVNRADGLALSEPGSREAVAKARLRGDGGLGGQGEPAGLRAIIAVHSS